MLKLIMSVLNVVGCVASLISGEPYTGTMVSNSRAKSRRK